MSMGMTDSYTAETMMDYLTMDTSCEAKMSPNVTTHTTDSYARTMMAYMTSKTSVKPDSSSMKMSMGMTQSNSTETVMAYMTAYTAM